MASHASALRAVSSLYAKRLIRLGGFIMLAVFGILLIATWLLAQYVSNYWWLALIFIVPPALIGLFIFLVCYFLANLLYRKKMTPIQKKLVKEYVDKISSIVETTQLSYFIVFSMAKDLILYREFRTLKQFVNDSGSLKKDLDHLADKL